MTTLLERLLNTVSSRFRVNAGDWFVGDLTLQQGENVDLQKVGNVVTVNASLASKTRLRGNAAPYISGDLTLASGAGITVGQVGSTITFSSSASTSGIQRILTSDGNGGFEELLGPDLYLQGGTDSPVEVYRDDFENIRVDLDPEKILMSACAFGQAPLFGDITFKGGAGVTLVQTGQEIEIQAYALPAPYTAALNSGDLVITAPSVAGVASAIRTIGRPTTAVAGFGGLVQLKGGAAPSGTGGPVILSGGDGGTAGGDVQIAGGDGTAKGAVRFGYISAGLFTQRWSIGMNYIADSAGLTFGSRLWEQSGGIAATPWVFRTNLTGGTLATAISNTIASFEWKYDFSDTSRKPLELQYDRAIVSGKLVHKQAVSSKIRVEVDPVDVDTSSTTATTISSYTVGVSEMVTVTATLQHDNGTTNGRTVYTHTFRSNGAGAVTATGSAEDMSLASKALGHTQTITVASGVISVKVVAAAATATKHRGQVAYEIGSNA